MTHKRVYLIYILQRIKPNRENFFEILLQHFTHYPIVVTVQAVDIKAFHIGCGCIICLNLQCTGFVFRLCFCLRREVCTVQVITDAVRPKDFETLFVFYSRLGERACLPKRPDIQVPISQLQSQCRQNYYHQHEQQSFHFSTKKIHRQEYQKQDYQKSYTSSLGVSRILKTLFEGALRSRSSHEKHHHT